MELLLSVKSALLIIWLAGFIYYLQDYLISPTIWRPRIVAFVACVLWPLLLGAEIACRAWEETGRK